MQIRVLKSTAASLQSRLRLFLVSINLTHHDRPIMTADASSVPATHTRSDVHNPTNRIHDRAIAYTAVQNGTLAVLTCILLLGAALRIIHLGAQPLWADEGFSAFAISQPDLLQALARDVHPPLYFVGLKLWAGLAGMSELALRWFTLLPSMVSIALIVPLAKELGRIRPQEDAANPFMTYVPVLAALLMALSEMEFYIVQEVRSYSLHIMLALLSTWAFLRWIRLAKGRRLMAAVWLVSMTALLYTHYLGAWMGVVHGLYALLFLRGRQRLTAVGLLVIPAALFVGWLIFVVLPYQTFKADADQTIDQSNLETLAWYARSYLTQQWPLMLGILMLGLVNIKDGVLRFRPINGSALLLMWIIVPVLLTFMGNLRFSIMTYYRISLIAPAFVLLWAFGLSAFPRLTRLFLIAVITVYGVMSVDFYRPKFPEPQFAALASDFAVPGDMVLMDMKGVDFSPQYYLTRQLSPDVRLASLRQYTHWDPPGLYNELIPQINAADTVWLSRWNDEPLAFDLLRDGGHIQTAHRLMMYGDDRLEAYRFDKPVVYDGEPVTQFGKMALRHAEIHPDRLRVDLWWSVDKAVSTDFTTSAILLDESGRLVAQYDSQPFLNERPTSTWAADEVVYEPKSMRLVDGIESLAPGTYQVGIQVYRLTRDGQINQTMTEDDQPYVVVGTITR